MAATDRQTSQAVPVGVALAAAPALRAAFDKIPATGQWDKRAWALLVAGIVRRHASAAAALAVRQYRQERQAARVTQPFTPRQQEPTLTQIGSTTDWTLGTLYSDGGTRQAAEANLLTGSERLILNAHRDTIAVNAERDKAARGWARETEPGCCWWCAMLATRGAVYLSQQSATHKSGGDEGFHNNCRCTAVPVFNAYEPTAQAREWQALWERTMRPENGPAVTGMANMQAAWKAAFADWQSQR